MIIIEIFKILQLLITAHNACIRFFTTFPVTISRMFYSKNNQLNFTIFTITRFNVYFYQCQQYLSLHF